MHYLWKFLDSTVGQKVVTAATGIGLIGFVVAHLGGNLQIFAGPEAINAYALKLQKLGVLLWLARLGLLGLIVLHIAMTVRLAWRNRKAAAGRYAVKKRQSSTWHSRYMIVSGSVILAFVLFHLAHFTFGWIQPELHALKDAAGRHDVYTMVTVGFENWLIAGVYVVGLAFLASHLSHAMYSALQTLGLKIGGKDTVVRSIAKVAAIITIIGFLSIPLAVLAGLLG